MSDGAFDREVARTYDDDNAARFAPHLLDAEVHLLTELAAGRRVLEFASGTGRVALPLVRSGLDVSAIELSRAMVDRMMTKPGSEQVDVTIGDMATTRVPGTFGLVFLVYNTITNLLTQDAQVACFANAARHLEPGGCFVVETIVPSLQRLAPGERHVPFDVSPTHTGIDEYDVVEQIIVSHHYHVRDGATDVFRSRHRYAWPAEYDLMARIAGLRLRDRWGDWRRSPFSATSTSHVSVWEKPAP